MEHLLVIKNPYFINHNFTKERDGMKKKLSVPMIIFKIHLFICIFLSFDWSFLEGMYMGFVPTFLVIWGLTLPAIIACISIGSVIVQAKNKEKLSVLEIITVVVGGIILLVYPASACGFIKQNILQVVIFLGVHSLECVLLVLVL